MNELQQILAEVLNNYGLVVVLFACATIFLIGVLKYFNAFRKVEKSNRKPIYLSLTYVFAFGLSAIYFGIYGLDFNNYIAFATIIATTSSLLYPLYENLKLRDLLAILGNFIIKVVAKKQVENEVEKLKTEKTLGLLSIAETEVEDTKKN